VVLNETIAHQDLLAFFVQWINEFFVEDDWREHLLCQATLAFRDELGRLFGENFKFWNETLLANWTLNNVFGLVFLHARQDLFFTELLTALIAVFDDLKVNAVVHDPAHFSGLRIFFFVEIIEINKITALFFLLLTSGRLLLHERLRLCFNFLTFDQTLNICWVRDFIHLLIFELLQFSIKLFNMLL